MTTVLGTIDPAVIMHGVALVPRAPNVHIVMVSEYPNIGYAAKIDDVKRLAQEFLKGQPRAVIRTTDLRDGGPAVGSYGAIHMTTTVEGRPASVDFFPFFGNPKIHVVHVLTIGDEESAISVGKELLATARVSPKYEPRSLTAPVPVDISEPLAKVTSWLLIAALLGGAWWAGKKARK